MYAYTPILTIVRPSYSSSSSLPLLLGVGLLVLIIIEEYVVCDIKKNKT